MPGEPGEGIVQTRGHAWTRNLIAEAPVIVPSRAFFQALGHHSRLRIALVSLN